jgi:hypothetical protein
VRRALLSVVLGLAGAAGVAVSGWALQAAALPPPTPAARVAADASTWFHEYRLVVDVFHFDHRRTSGACLRGWFGHSHGHKARESLLSLESGTILRTLPKRRVAVFEGHPNRHLPGSLAVGAGCSLALAATLAEAAQTNGDMTVSRAYAANQPAIALKVSRGREKRLTLYVSPETRRPLVAIVAIADHEATARLYLTRVRRAVLAHFHLLWAARPGPGP